MTGKHVHGRYGYIKDAREGHRFLAAVRELKQTAGASIASHAAGIRNPVKQIVDMLFISYQETVENLNITGIPRRQRIAAVFGRVFQHPLISGFTMCPGKD